MQTQKAFILQKQTACRGDHPHKMVRTVQKKGTQALLTRHLRNSKHGELIFVLNWSGKEQIHGAHIDWMGFHSLKAF